MNADGRHRFACSFGIECVFDACRCKICGAVKANRMAHLPPTVIHFPDPPEKENPVTEYRKGDKIRVTDVSEGVITEITTNTLRIDGSIYAREHMDIGRTRTIEVIERAPAPWQAGDIVSICSGRTLRPYINVRQANGAWLDSSDGSLTGWSDGSIGANSQVTVIVRGGVRV